MQRKRLNVPKLSKKGVHGPHDEATSHKNVYLGQLSSKLNTFEDVLPVPEFSYVYCGALIGCFSLICFWQSVYGDFVFDDSKAVVNNRDVTGSLSHIFSHDFWGSDILSNVSHKSYRPLTTLTFKLNYYVAGGMHPWGFHFVNILVHTIVCILFLFVFDIIYGGNDFNNSLKLNCPKASLLSALLFTVHPVHTESVCSIVGRAELLSSLMFCIAFLFYAQSCKQENYLKMFFCLSISMMSTAMAMLLKEQGITVLGLCCVYDSVLVFDRIAPKNTASKLSSTKHERKIKDQVFPELRTIYTIKPFIYRQLIMVICGILMILCRFLVMGRTTPNFKPIDNPASFLQSVVLRVINYNYIYAINIWLLIFPWWLCFDWSMGCVPLIKTVNDFRILAPVIMWLVLLYISWCVVFSRKRSIFLIGLSLLVVPFLPASNLFFQVGFVVAERVLYLSIGGYCILFVLGIAFISKNVHRKVSFILTYGCLVLFIWRTVHRSREWLNEEVLFVSGLKVCPLNAKVHYNIGKVKADANNISEALTYYHEAIRLHPQYDQAYNNLGNLLQGIGDSPGAEKALEKALSIRPNFAAACMNLGIAKSSLKKYQAAEGCYLKALRYRNSYTDAHYNLGNLYIDWKKPKKAVQQFEIAIHLNPLKENAWNNLIILLDNTGELKHAVVVSEEALQFLPNSASINYSFGNILGKMKRFEESERHFLQAIRIDNSNSNFYGNLGVLYHRWEKTIEAEKSYTKALKLNSNNQMVKENLEKLQKKMGNYRNT